MKLSTILAASAVTAVSAHSVRHARNLSGKSAKESHHSHHHYPGPPSNHPPLKWGPSYGSGKSNKNGHWVKIPVDSWGGHHEKPPPPSYWGSHSSSSSKSGKSSSSKSGKSSGKSGKSSGKSGKGSWDSSSKSSKGSSSKSSKGSSVKYIWVGPGHPYDPPPPFHIGSGKSGKGGKGSKGGNVEYHYYYHPKPKDDDDAWAGSEGDDEHVAVEPDEDDAVWQDDGHEDDDYSSGAAWEDDGHDDDGSWGDDGYDDDEGANYYNDVCFHKGKVITCSGAPEGDAIHVEFSYSVETSGVDPEDTVSPLEGAILDATVDYVSSLDESYHGVTRVSSDPADYITDEEICTPKHSGHECSIVKGEMTVYADAHEMGACDYSSIIQASMDTADLSSIDGVKEVEYLESGSSCADSSKIISGEAAVVEDEGLTAGAMVGLAMLAAFIAAAALLLARKLRRKSASDRDFDLISVDTDFEGRGLGSTDPFASTVDVHKCTSMYCNCNKGGAGTKFLPAPRKSNMDKVIKKQGLDSSSPTGVDEADAQGFFVGDPEPLETVSMNSDEVSHDSSQPKDDIIRADPQPDDRALTPVREIAHDSEIDTEFESDGEEDLESIPPPPPLPPGHPKRNSLQEDEMSV